MIRDGLEGVERYIRLNKLSKWNIKNGGGQNDFVFKTNDDLSVDDNIKLMYDVLENVAGGRLYFNGTPNDKMKTGWYSETFSLNMDADRERPSQTVGALPAVGMVTTEELDRRIEEARQQWNRDQEMLRLKDELSDAKKEIDDLRKPLNEVIRRLAPIVQPAVGAIMQRLSGTPAASPATIGTVDAHQEVTPPEEQSAQTEQDAQHDEFTTPEEDEVLRLYNEWKKIDAECFELFKAIATIGIKRQPVMGMDYAAVKQMIINLAKQ